MLYPKIGIRPVIDGRWGGVRESLEAQTMAMAENAAKLISENLKYPDGTPVQCVVGCTTIDRWRCRGSSRCRAVFHAERNGNIISNTMLVLWNRDI